MSILETGSVLKTTDFNVHWFVDRQHFINPPALRLREPAVIHEAWKLSRPARAGSGNALYNLDQAADVQLGHLTFWVERVVMRFSQKPVARRPNAKAPSTARGSNRNKLTDRNDVEAGRPVGQPSDQGPIPGPSQAAARALARDRVSCGCKSQTACNTNNCSCRRANVLCGKRYHKGNTRCGNRTDAKLEASQQTEKLLLVEQCLQKLTGVLH
ncbi:hypothetical protein E4U60_006797 [Claviceps pazoutovae]|uniref:Uncharacterized protein n=1 Tax=Claviceps pazoutovae TaxID=1649127 RepID=A0A9P7SE75_9HYPO|nr:hypothetical protein E4U60_006797 [Claviceps pazoutovae]